MTNPGIQNSTNNVLLSLLTQLVFTLGRGASSIKGQDAVKAPGYMLGPSGPVKGNSTAIQESVT